MNITELIYSLEPNQHVFINRKANSTLNSHVNYVRSIAYHTQNKKFSVNKISPSILSRKCGVLVTRVL